MMVPMALAGWLCLAAASLAACHAGAVVACDTGYASPAGFSVRCPSGFQATGQIRQVDGLGLEEAIFEDTSDDDRYTHEMAAGRTDLAPGTTLDEFAAQAAASAEGDGFSTPTDTTRVLMDGEAAIRTTYTTTAAPLGYFILENMQTCEDGRFCLDYEGPGVHVVRVITVHEGAGYWLTLYAAPGRESADDALFEQFLGSFHFATAADPARSSTAVVVKDEPSEWASTVTTSFGTVAVGMDDSRSLAAWLSSDGGPWTRATRLLGRGTGSSVDWLLAGGPGVVAIGTSPDGWGTVSWTTADGRTWAGPRDIPFSDDFRLMDVFVWGSRLVAVGETFIDHESGDKRANGEVWVSTDGLEWARASTPSSFDGLWLERSSTGGDGLIVHAARCSSEGACPDERWTTADLAAWRRID
jgi:hypothetical protein